MRRRAGHTGRADPIVDTGRKDEGGDHYEDGTEESLPLPPGAKTEYHRAERSGNAGYPTFGDALGLLPAKLTMMLA